MTAFDISASDWRFPVTMLSVCVPFFLLILILQTRTGLGAVKKFGRLIGAYFHTAFSTGGRDRRQHQHQYQPQQLQLQSQTDRGAALRRTQSGFNGLVNPGSPSDGGGKGRVGVGWERWWLWVGKRRAVVEGPEMDVERGKRDDHGHE
ncbi:hypothetical protein B0T19DRAFT_274589 [Cercophora scortea]|uniref:Uncharacterized protein n=1 Tax=Cercophora scortea TaxID=314031 RepID=A0AAE0I785_9PEZI|nr:hypothetical protein B0T19DRAFT_274589 [Cercophora scortea]